MVCTFSTASKCVDSFDGSILFASRSDYQKDKNIASYDYSRTAATLNVFTYYLLVLVSFTGLCTLLGQTQIPLFRDECEQIVPGEGNVVASKSDPDLQVPSKIIEYMLERSQEFSQQKNESSDSKTARTPELMLTRRFELNFGKFLSVVMLHFVCSNGRKHLVEVYSLNDSWMGKIAGIFENVAKLVIAIMERRKKKQA